MVMHLPDDNDDFNNGFIEGIKSLSEFLVNIPDKQLHQIDIKRLVESSASHAISQALRLVMKNNGKSTVQLDMIENLIRVADGTTLKEGQDNEDEQN